MCKNPTCSAAAESTYCSGRCKAAMNNRGHLVALPDIWVGRDTERALVAAARADGLTVRQVVTLLVEREWGDTL